MKLIRTTKKHKYSDVCYCGIILDTPSINRIMNEYNYNDSSIRFPHIDESVELYQQPHITMAFIGGDANKLDTRFIALMHRRMTIDVIGFGVYLETEETEKIKNIGALVDINSATIEFDINNRIHLNSDLFKKGVLSHITLAVCNGGKAKDTSKCFDALPHGYMKLEETQGLKTLKTSLYTPIQPVTVTGTFEFVSKDKTIIEEFE